MTAFERVQGNAIYTPSELAEREGISAPPADAKRAWRDAHPDAPSPVRRHGPGILQSLREALDPATEDRKD